MTPRCADCRTADGPYVLRTGRCRDCQGDAFRVVVADPPWLNTMQTRTGSASKHYAQMSTAAVCEYWRDRVLPRYRVAWNCTLLLWRLSCMPRAALDVSVAWGFGDPISEFQWDKRTRSGKRHFGQGWQCRISHEICHVSRLRRGARVLSRSQRSSFEGLVRGHSRKPEEFYALVERVYRGPYLELFATERRPGWTCDGLALAPQPTLAEGERP